MMNAVSAGCDVLSRANASKRASKQREESLLRDISLGRIKAFEFLYSEYYNELCVFAQSLVRASDEAEDIVQNVMISLWEKRATLTISKSLKSYLYRAVYNGFVNLYRKKRKEITALHEVRYQAMMVFSELDNSVIEKKMVFLNAEIDKLPKKCREIFVMSKKQGLKYREIAEELQISIKTVEAQMSRALKKINAAVNN